MLSEDMKYDVSIIMINYNSSDYTIKCVNTILGKTSEALNYHIVIIDNSSVEADFRNLDVIRNIGKVKIVRSKINLGFAAGNMYALNFTNARYFFFLNNDCKLINDCCSILFDFCEKNKDAGICSPQLFSETSEAIASFNYYPTLPIKLLGTGVLRILKGKKFKPRKSVYSNPIEVDVLSGSQLFARSNAFNKIGGFDTTFFLYCEEEDLCLRMKKSGYNNYLVPQAKNYHLGGGSTNKDYLIRREFYISLLYFYRKHYGFFRRSIMKYMLFLKILRKSYKDTECFKLAFFVLFGANSKYSLRHRQEIVEIEN